MTFAKPSEYAGGSYFKPADHMNDLAILLEPKKIDRDVPSTYKGATRTRDEVTADISIFDNQEALDKGVPSEIIKNGKVVHGMLTSTLEKILGQPMVATLAKVDTKAGSGYVFRDASAEDEAKVADYYQKREQEIAAAVEAAPDFE